MITRLTSNLSNGHQFQWIDIADPQTAALEKITKDFDLHPTSVQDCLEPYHLPKYERQDEYVFMLMRAVDPLREKDCTDVNKLTRKVAIFLGKDFLITIHRSDLPFVQHLRKKWEKRLPLYQGDPKLHLCLDILNHGFNTFDPPIDEALAELGTFEQENSSDLAKVYILRKQSSIFKRLLRLSHEICVKLTADCDTNSRIYVQDLKEDLENSLFFAEDLNEGIHHYLNLQLSLQSQRTNEVMRILAIFSAFFMPLTFIVGLYGMNFRYMPELEWQYGYLFSILVMVSMSAAIYLWFKKRKWM